MTQKVQKDKKCANKNKAHHFSLGYYNFMRSPKFKVLNLLMLNIYSVTDNFHRHLTRNGFV